MHLVHVLARKGVTVITIRPEQSIRQALGLLAEHNIGALVVVDERGFPVGIVSERDIVREAVKNERLFTMPVVSIMSRDLVVALPTDDLHSAGKTMTERRIRHLPVMDGGSLVGIVSLGDVVKAERDLYQGEVDTLQIQLLEPHP